MKQYLLIIVAFVAACSFEKGKPPESLTVTSSTTSIERNGHTTVDAAYMFGTVAVPAEDVTWTSSNPAVATVTGTGHEAMVTAVVPGLVSITAHGTDLAANVDITVLVPHVTAVAVTPSGPSVVAGLDVQLSAMATYSDAMSADVTNTATWTSSDTNKATVLLGHVHSLAMGAATISAAIGGSQAGTLLTVTAPQLLSIDVGPTNPLVAKGVPQQFSATGHFTDTSTSVITSTVTWGSTNTNVATISNASGSQGRAATLATGTTTISATSGSISGTTVLMVQSAALESIAITPANPAHVPKSADFPFTATGTFSDNTQSDLTVQATWSSSNMNVATISNAQGSEGVADAKTLGTTTITATVNTFQDATQMTVELPVVGAWTAETFTGTPCLVDAIKISLFDTSAMLESAYVCTTSGGVQKGTIASDGSVTWAAANSGIDNLDGLSLATHRQGSVSSVMFMAVPGANTVGNWFRSQNSGSTWAGMGAPLLDTASNPRYIYAGRFQAMIGNMMGTWDPTPQAVVLTQQGTNPAVIHNVSSATGTVRAIGGTNTPSNLFAVVLGETPSGGTASGGVYQSTGTASNWMARVTGIATGDVNNLTSIATADPGTAVPPNVTHYVGVRGGARVYKTTDNGANWSASGSGIPAKAKVSTLYIPPGQNMVIYAATDIGLYKSSDAGVTWALDGFQGRAIRGIGQSERAPTLILVAIDSSEAGDQPLYHHN